MHISFFWQILYWCSTPILAILGGVFLWRRLHREFPFFFSYVVVALLSDVARIVTYQMNSSLYRHAYWNSQVLNLILALAAIYELFFKRLFPQFHKITFYRYLFVGALLVISSLATVTALYGVRLLTIFKLLQGAEFLRVASLLFLFAFMIFMGRQWTRYTLGIASGFSLDAAAFLATYAFASTPGKWHDIIAIFPVIAYDLACVIWLICFLGTEKRKSGSTEMAVSQDLVGRAKAMESNIRDSLKRKESSPKE